MVNCAGHHCVCVCAHVCFLVLLLAMGFFFLILSVLHSFQLLFIYFCLGLLLGQASSTPQTATFTPSPMSMVVYSFCKVLFQHETD